MNDYKSRENDVVSLLVDLDQTAHWVCCVLNLGEQGHDGDDEEEDDLEYSTCVKCQKSLLVWIPVSPDSSTTSV